MDGAGPFIEHLGPSGYRSGETPADAGAVTRAQAEPDPESPDPRGGARTDEVAMVLKVEGRLPTDGERLRRLAGDHIEPVAGRCVQCGICSYNCPVGIDVRGHARRALPILDSHCLSCGACVARCPRGVLRWTREEEAA